MDNTGTQLNSDQLHRILQRDSLAIMGAKEPELRPSNQFSLASTFSRFIARFLDLVIINFFCIVLTCFVITIGLTTIPDSKIDSSLLECFSNTTLYEIRQTTACREIFELLKTYYVIALILTLLCNLFYFIYIPVYNRGASFGKQILKIKIISDTKKSPKLKLIQNFWREIFFSILHISLLIRGIDMIYISKNAQSINQFIIVSSQILIILVIIYSFLNIYFSLRGQSLSDKFANTLVVND
jgi:uncharacterized RDD family membrane protein YckC